MTEFIDRQEARYLDLLFLGIHGILSCDTSTESYDGIIVNEHGIRKWTGQNSNKSLVRRGAELHNFGYSQRQIQKLLFNYNIDMQKKGMRIITDILLALDIAEETTKKEHIQSKRVDSFQNFDPSIDKTYILNMAQQRRRKFIKKRNSSDLLGLEFGSQEWLENIRSRMLKYGYFVRFIDSIKLSDKYFRNNSNQSINLCFQKNLIGPFDRAIKGSGPEFVQTSFFTWAFWTDVIKIKTPGLITYNFEKKIEKLQKDKGFLGVGQGKKAYRRLSSAFRNLQPFEVNYNTSNEVIISSFHRFANNNTIRSIEKSKETVGNMLLKLRLLYLLDNDKGYLFEDFENDRILNEIVGYYNLDDKNLIYNILYLESMGLSYEIQLEDNEENFSSLTEYILNHFLEHDDNFKKNMFKSGRNSPIVDLHSNSKLLNDLPYPISLKKRREFNKSIFENLLPPGTLFQRIINE